MKMYFIRDIEIWVSYWNAIDDFYELILFVQNTFRCKICYHNSSISFSSHTYLPSRHRLFKGKRMILMTAKNEMQGGKESFQTICCMFKLVGIVSRSV